MTTIKKNEERHIFSTLKPARNVPGSAVTLSYNPLLLNTLLFDRSCPHLKSVGDCYYRHSPTGAIPRYAISDSRYFQKEKIKNINKFKRAPDISSRK